MSRSMKVELCAWLVLAPSLLWFVQVTGCWSTGQPVTWPRLLLSTVMGLAGGWIAWASQFGLRWWCFTQIGVAMLLVRWHVLFGGEPLHKHALAETLCCVWMAAGVVGGLLYSSWLTWKYPWESSEGGALLYAWLGVYLGVPLFAWAAFRTVQRVMAGGDARLVGAWMRLRQLDLERATVALFILRNTPRAGRPVQGKEIEQLT